MIRQMLEKYLGTMSDDLFKTICEMATDDIKANRILYGKTTTMHQIKMIGISAYGALRRL